MDEMTFIERLRARWWYWRFKFGFWKQLKRIAVKNRLFPYKRRIQIETIEKLVEYLDNGGGSFRTFIYGYLDMNYYDVYMAGGMELTNRAELLVEDNGTNT